MTAKPLPEIRPESQEFWNAANRGELLFQTCEDCGNVQFYPRNYCTGCTSDKLRWAQSQGEGVVYTFTVVHRPPSAAFKADVPYVIALVDLDEGFRMMMNVRGCGPDEVGIGARVRIIFETIPESEQKLPQAELIR